MRLPFHRSSLSRCLWAPSAPLTLLLVLGCAGMPQQAPSLYALPEDDGNGCTPALARIDAVDEPTPLGFAAIEALMRLDGPRSSPLVWLEPASNPEYLLELGPERGLSTLEIDVRAGEGPILHRFHTPLFMAPEGTTCDAGELEIPIHVTLESGSQGLSESFDTVLRARTPYRGRIEAQLEPGALRGSLGLASVSSLDPARAFWLGPLRLEVDVWEGGSSGALAVELGARHAEQAGQLEPPEAPARPGSIAVWPSAALCEGGGNALPSHAKVLGFSVDDVLAELQGSGPRRATWSDGSEAALALELSAEAVEPCQKVGDSLSFGATLRARSEDGIEVRSAVRVEALDAGGRVGEIRIESAEPEAPSPIAGASGRAATIGSDGYAAVLVAVEWTHDGSRDSGSLSLRGVDAPAPDANGVYRSTALASARW